MPHLPVRLVFLIIFTEDFDEQEVTIGVLWLRVEQGTALWRDLVAEMLFIDFTFLDLKGAETETPQSLPKPSTPDELCHFNFTKNVTITENRKRMLSSLLKNPEDDLIVFRVVSDSEKFDVTSGECEDVGVATITVKDFYHHCNNGPFQLKVKNIKDRKEIIGTLSVNIEATPSLLINKK